MSESKTVERHEDMSPLGRLRITFQPDGDMIVGIVPDPGAPEWERQSVEFTASPVRSPETRKAIAALALAMEHDNRERPLHKNDDGQNKVIRGAAKNIVLWYVPQSYGVAVGIWGERIINCESHEWDNRTTTKNLAWLLERLHAGQIFAHRREPAVQELQAQVPRPAVSPITVDRQTFIPDQVDLVEDYTGSGMEPQNITIKPMAYVHFSGSKLPAVFHNVEAVAAVTAFAACRLFRQCGKQLINVGRVIGWMVDPLDLEDHGETHGLVVRFIGGNQLRILAADSARFVSFFTPAPEPGRA